MDKPAISVVIPLYNHESYIEETVASVLAQTEGNFELIVIDDGSTDNSADIVKGVSDERIRFFQQKNRGAHNTINRGIELARGEFLALLNSDDLYSPMRLEKCCRFMRDNASVDAVFTELECIDEQGQHLYNINCIPLYQNKGTRTHQDLIIALDLLADNFFTTTSNLFCRKSIFKGMEPFRGFRYCHDWDFFLRLTYSKHVRVIRDRLIQYRIHPSNTLKEDKAGVFYEMGLVLADFFHNHELEPYVDSPESSFPLEVFRSLRYHYIDRILAVLAIISQNEEKPVSISSLIDEPDNPFKEECLQYIRHLINNDDYHQLVLDENKELHEQVEQLKNENTALCRTFTNRVARKLRQSVECLSGSSVTKK